MTAADDLLPVFDFYQITTMPEPAAQFALWRAAGPLIKGGPGQWGVTRHPEVLSLLKDRRVSHSMPPEYTDFMMGAGPSSEFRQNSLLMKDGPAHHRLRRLMSSAFTPQLVQQLRGRVRAMVDAMILPLLEGDAANVVEALAFPLPVAVICELMGIDPTDRDEVRRHSAQIFGADREASDRAVLWLRSYMVDVLSHRRADPDGDLLDRMLEAGSGADGFSPQEIVDNAVLLFFAGFETTRHLIASGCLALARRPDQFRILQRVPHALVSAVEELLRYDSPVRVVSTMALEPVAIGDRLIKAGHVLYLIVASANHDEQVFDHPEELDVRRSPNPHLSFGGGAHRCLGMHLARLEAEVVFGCLAERIDELELVGQPTPAVSVIPTYSEILLRATPSSRLRAFS